MKTTYTLAELAEKIPGATTLGDVKLEASAFVHPQHVQGVQDLPYIASDAAWACIDAGARCGLIDAKLDIPEHIQAKIDQNSIGLIQVVRSRVALAVLSDLFEKPAQLATEIHPTAFIHPTAQLGQNVRIGAHVSVGEGSVLGDGVQLFSNVSVGALVEIGEGSRLHAGARVEDRCRLGKRCILQPNAVIGSDGFSYVTPQEARHEKGGKRQAAEAYEAILRINSLGNVVLEDEVEVGACTCIDRGTLAETRIRRGTKIDNLVQIGHNNELGENNLIVSQVGLSGSCQTGKNVVIAGQCGIGDHVKIGENSIIMARSAAISDIEPNSTLQGAPAIPYRKALANVAASTRLAEMAREAKQLKRKLESFEDKAKQLDALLELIPEDMKAQLVSTQ